MKQSEVSAKARTIISKVFFIITKSDDKAAWKKAINSINQKIYTLKLRRDKNPESETIVDLWTWERVHFIMIGKFGKKFITSK